MKKTRWFYWAGWVDANAACYKQTCNSIHIPCVPVFSLESAIPLLKNELEHISTDSPVAIAFPDDGAHKRFHLMFESAYPTIVCHKIRNGKERIVRVKDGMKWLSISVCPHSLKYHAANIGRNSFLSDRY